MSLVAALRRRETFRLWLGLLASAVGDQLYDVAVMWTAVERIGGAAGLVAASSMIARLLLGPLGGVLADRWDRRHTMIGADLARAALVASLPLWGWAGLLSLPLLAAVAALLGALDALFTPALHASLPALSGGDPKTMQGTNALVDVTRRLARVVGPSLAGALAATIPLTHFFTVDAATFVLSALALLSLGRRVAWRAPAGDGGSVRAELAAALRLARRDRLIWWGLLGNGATCVGWAIAFSVGAPLVTAQILHAGVATFGMVVATYGAGNVLGNLGFGGFTLRHRRTLLFVGKVALGVGFLGFALAPSLPWAVAGVAVAAVGGPLGDLSMHALLQQEVPPAQLGKLYSLKMVVEAGGVGLGLILAGPVFAILPVRWGIAVGALIMLATGIVGLWRFRASRR